MLLTSFALLSALSLPLVSPHPFYSTQATHGVESSHMSLFARLRNALVKLTPGQSSIGTSISPSPGQFVSAPPRPPNAFKERYDRDIVLRFNVSTEKESAALAEAVDTLFLDVWDVTAEWADIRLAKDVGREIKGLRIGVHPQNSEQPADPRQTILVLGGSHAREWISVSSVSYAAYSMITSYGKSREITRLMEEFDWVFVPTLNPDGYVYTWEVDRLWRKNAQQTSLQFCKGLDVDRSFGFGWDGKRTKGNPCSESFAGDIPFQAVEALRLANWVKNETERNNVEFTGFVDLHSYSQQVLYPYSYSCIETPPTLENLEEAGLGLSKAMHQVSGEVYGVTSACKGSVVGDQEFRNERQLWPRIESSGGTALDWMYHDVGVKYAYQIKLRDTGNYGFLLPQRNIIPTGEEVFGALKFFGHYLLSKKGVEAANDSPSSRKGLP
ncbi:MAG: hypothetical protein LQ340_003779 [Diploschistes diacapsis]|nr:MAG: hypothetical protein LQ340_003779 [Diploschistes diacapsis]